MRKSIFVLFAFLLMLSPIILGLKVTQRYPIGTAPMKLLEVENRTGKYFLVLVKGDSEILVLNEKFEPIRYIDDLKRDKIQDIIYHNKSLYCFGFHSGRIIIIDISGKPGEWKIKQRISTGERLITGVFLEDTLGVLSYDNKFLMVDIKKGKTVKTLKLPVTALSMVAKDKYFFVSLFYNYNLLTNEYDTEHGLYVIDKKGQLVKTLKLGKRPSYMFIVNDYLGVVNYLSSTVDIISTKTFRKIKTFNVGKYPNFPVISGDIVWISSTGEDRIYQLNIKKLTMESYPVEGRGPIKCVRINDNLFVLNAISGELELKNLNGSTIQSLDLKGYPIDLIFNDSQVAILLFEDFKFNSTNGSLVVINF